MSPELEKSLKERIAARVGYEEIEAELLSAGYSKEVIALAYATAKQGTSNKPTGALSTGTELFTAGWAFAKTRFDLILLLGLSSAVLSISMLFVEDVTTLVPATVLGVISIIALVVYVLGVLAAYYIVAKGQAESVSLPQSMRWAVKHFFSLLWLFILSLTIIWAGFFLLIIPGILLGILLYFAQYAYIHEGVRGLSALLRSRAVVTGRMLRVLKRLFIVAAYGLLFTMLTAVPYILFELYGVTSVWIEGGVEILAQLITAAVMVVGLAAANQLFLELAADRPLTAPLPKVVTRYRLLGIFGVIAMAATVAGVIALASLDNEFTTELGLEVASEQVRGEVIFTEPIAETYRAEQGTYEGVCEVVAPVITTADQVECNDNETTWALAAQTGTEYWCTDVTGYGKLIPGPLGERTQCLNLPTEQMEEELPALEATSSTPVNGSIEPVIPMM